ncbi:Glycoside hydrolase, subgroup, catalytic core [Metarhizium album ARSEF 1941]|uniref:cellulase n=1 Tax=Metarhizium album (strain ARSEF 1941) TaxID=1081103 RepID=A0A0B2WNM2_METAS|nr:Glycoside hydrolase, subgroup, catalytic core [Metarhizium album ARSEF 1941]KHN95583.1 Glycoside hydrolase, subgroup, catalytic core [Metarhizium album ARSEF 1941]
MAGAEFGCDIDGSCPVDNVQVPLESFGGADSAGQMKHLVRDDGMNTFRLPMTWQFVTANKPSGPLDKANFNNFDKLVQACLDTGAYCMLDLHNFARYDGGIIGQGGQSDDVFASLWKQIATHYAKNDKIIFGLMNEPHALDINTWAKSCQAAVTAIREAGAESQIILLPGTNFASAETFVSTGSADALAAVTNPDGTTDNLLLDLHKYLDRDNSGSHAECTTNNVAGFQTIAEWLRKNKRLALISESGASMDPSNDDVFVGFVGWGAGGLDVTYLLTLTPSKSGDAWTDNKLMKQCIIAIFGRPQASSTTQKPTSTSATSATSSTSTEQTTQEAASPTPAGTRNTNANAATRTKENAAGRVLVSTLHIILGSILGLKLCLQ